ncbi:hypothetical protein PCE1_003133 [Barthelona sp. PCE]
MPFVEISDKSVFYNVNIRNETNPLIICLHNIFSSSTSFEPLIGAVEQFNTLVVDLPNHGQSSDCEYSDFIDISVGALQSLIEEINPRHFFVICHGVGTIVANALFFFLIPSISDRCVAYYVLAYNEEALLSIDRQLPILANRRPFGKEVTVEEAVLTVNEPMENAFKAVFARSLLTDGKYRVDIRRLIPVWKQLIEGNEEKLILICQTKQVVFVTKSLQTLPNAIDHQTEMGKMMTLFFDKTYSCFQISNAEELGEQLVVFYRRFLSI